jgi:hypothetical protein
MVRNKPYVEVCYYDDRGYPSPPNNYRPELIVGSLTLLLDFREYSENNGCMTKKKANSLAKRIASGLGIEARLV